MAKKRAKKATKKPASKKPPAHRFGVIKIPRGAKVTWGDQWSVLNITDTGYESD